MESRTVEVKTYDLGKIKYLIKCDGGEVYYKTVVGKYVTTSWGPVIALTAEDTGVKLAGEWEAYGCDCGTIVNSRKVKSVRAVETYKYTLEVRVISDTRFFGLCENKSLEYKLLNN